jgi:hypothetical protein
MRNGEAAVNLREAGATDVTSPASFRDFHFGRIHRIVTMECRTRHKNP